jgi:hypothetical protein
MLREILAVLRSDYAFVLVTASLAALVVTIAYALVGFLGVAIIGLATLFVCVHLELSQEHPAGGMIYPPDHPWRAGENDGTGRAARAGRRNERAALRRALVFAKLLGVALTVVGCGGFYLFQLG